MSRLHIAQAAYDRYTTSDRESGVPQTPERTRFNWDCAWDFADQLQLDYEREAIDREDESDE